MILERIEYYNIISKINKYQNLKKKKKDGSSQRILGKKMRGRIKWKKKLSHGKLRKNMSINLEDGILYSFR